MKPAITAGNGECLWELPVARRLIEVAVEHNLAILGCEVYRRHEVGWGTYLDYWDVDPPREARESWSAFAQRCAEFTAALLAGEPPETHGGNGRLYFLAACIEQHYGRPRTIERRGITPRSAHLGPWPVPDEIPPGA